MAEIEKIGKTPYRTLALVIFLGACGDKFSDPLAKAIIPQREVLTLSKETLTIAKAPLVLPLKEPLKISSGSFAVCLALRGDFPLQTTAVMNSEFDVYMKGEETAVEVFSSNGTRVALRGPNRTWSKESSVFARDELAACYFLPSDPSDLTGATINKISVSATPPFSVPGIYIVK